MVFHLHSLVLAWISTAFLNLCLLLHFLSGNKNVSSGYLENSSCLCSGNNSGEAVTQPTGLPANVIGFMTDGNFPMLFYPLSIPNMRSFVRTLIKGEQVSLNRINDRYESIAFLPAPIYFSPDIPVGLLILIKSAAGNVANRNAYRSTWANRKYFSKFDVPIVHAFLIGTGQYDGSIPAELTRESRMYRDIIFQDFLETYRNNTFKILGGFKWALQFGPDFEFLLMIDDDIYFSLPRAIELLTEPHVFNVSVATKGGNLTPSQFGFRISAEEYFYAGSKAPMNEPVRNATWKEYYLTYDEYPLEVFPEYIPGMTAFYSRATIREIYVASAYVKHLSIDDVYVGIIAAKLGISVTDLSAYVITDNFLEEAFPLPEVGSGSALISRHFAGNVTLELSVWKELHGKPTRITHSKK